MSDSSNWGFETKQIHAGWTEDPTTKSATPPIYTSTAFTFNSAEHARNLFALGEFGNIYTRIMNPTQDVVEQRIAALEGGTAALLVASGQAAETLAILNIAEAGDHIVTSSVLYGGTYNLFKHTFPKMGIEVTFVKDQDNLDEWNAAVQDNTKLFFGETIGNPKTNILDIEAVSEVAHKNGVPLLVDNTIATPYLINPIKHGADIVIHSATKYLGGHGQALAGAIVDGGKFEWSKSDKFPGLTTPDESYHGVNYTAALGDSIAYIIKARVQLLRDLGPAVAPQNAYQILQGIDTLSIRVERHNENATKVAQWLESHNQVERVNYASLDSSEFKSQADKYAPKGVGGILSFELKGGREAGEKFVEALTLFKHVANFGDVRSLVVHPASTTHSQLTEQQQLEAQVSPGLVRLSVGLETVEDIIGDLESAFKAVK